MRIASIAAAASSIGMLFAHSAGAAGAGEGDSEALEQVVVTGTRVANRSALETAAPVDIVLGDQLQNLGVSEINQALAASLPSFSFPRPGLSDGTDAVRPATLRGLAPDQTLVLVNSKRLHSAALVNVNGTIGRGSASADLNTIPICHRPIGRSATRRRICPIRLRCHRWRGQSPLARSTRRRRYGCDLWLARYRFRREDCTSDDARCDMVGSVCAVP